jgi:hypothetical protein
MRIVRYFCGLGLCVALIGGPVRSADLERPAGAVPLPEIAVAQAPKDAAPPKKKDDAKKKDDGAAPKKKDEAPPADLVAQAPAERPEFASLPRIRAPQFLGDYFLGSYVQRAITVSPIVMVTGVRSVTIAAVPVTRDILVPDVLLGAHKIAENESPAPDDRVFVDYNYYRNVRIPIQSGGAFPFAVTPFGPRLVFAGSGQLAVTTLDVHRELIGFEKTFFDGDASIGLRLPFLEGDGGNARLQGLTAPVSPIRGETATATAGVDGETGIGGGHVGDLSVVLKYALWNDNQTGNVLSTGLLLTVPSGDHLVAANGTPIDPVFLQPYVGFLWNTDNCYVHGFSSIAVPTLSADAIYMFNDVGVGYWLCRAPEGDRLLRAVVPTFEVHVNTPLNHRNGFQPGPSLGPTIGEDLLDLTAGAHLVFRNGSTLTVGASVPVTGPKPDDFEIIAQFNLRF